MCHRSVVHSPRRRRLRLSYLPGVTAAVLTFAVLLIAASAARAQSVPMPDDDTADAPPMPTVRQAGQLIQQQNYPEAQAMLETIIQAQPANGQAWFFLGFALHAQGKLDEALPAHLTAAEIAPSQARVIAMYNLACLYSLKDNHDRAFEWLDRALDNGYRNPEQMAQDTDFANITDDPRWADALTRAAATAPAGPMPQPSGGPASQPADDTADLVVAAAGAEWTSRPPRRQFDFWIGAWDAINASGQKVGANVITLRENGMMVHESWAGASGGTGQSINYYDPAAKLWRQAWVAPDGSVVHYRGKFKDGAMRYEGEYIAPDGTVTMAVCTLTPEPDGRIHHLIKHSSDGGTTWTTYFDAHYVRRQAN